LVKISSTTAMKELVHTPDFSDTRLAFQAKDNTALKRTYWLFRLIDNPFLTKVGPPMLNWSLQAGLPVKGIIRSTIFDMFVGGESLAQTVSRIEALDAYKVKTVLDYSVEGEKNEAGFDNTLAELIAKLEHGGQHDAVAFAAIKLTGLASFDLMAKIQAGQPLTESDQQAYDRVQQRLETLAKAAIAHNTPIFIDAEESWIQDVIDSLAEGLMETYNREKAWIWNTVQLYRHDRLDYLQNLIKRSQERNYKLGVKLVRGAYLEKENLRAEEKGYPTPMQPNKKATDRDYNAALAHCIRNRDHVSVCAGTHNEESTRYLVELMASYEMAPNDARVWFSQLLGMSDNLSFNLAYNGYNCAKYLPYGPVKAVMPYLIRRANENTSIAGQSSREVQLLKNELKRRRREG